MIIPSDLRVEPEPYAPRNLTSPSMPNEDDSFVALQYKFFDVLRLLGTIYEALGKHHCYASHFEAAFWAEHRKLQEATENNKILAYQLEELRTQTIHGRRRVPDSPNAQQQNPTVHRLPPIPEELEPGEEKTYRTTQQDTGLQAGSYTDFKSETSEQNQMKNVPAGSILRRLLLRQRYDAEVYKM
ncbi:uncharacterized protein F4822DRAFT_435459 [Hypoxylon trugodes]|uniref:uncharacterized protein n=1 Tax=Hypoxylon trugodes TaxID=326681 RepID=UPI002197EA7D|nr:uncharacterized protein F4822DRAFT_435459 [Hypoxylon trugodes]KAI1382557.1 hypothetical protein F4822DRAFT_435459 [Hypoxylon trugodes]